MQQTSRDEGRHPWQEPLGSVSLPFRCPRCGDHTRFRSLSSLRVHLEYSHSYEERSPLAKSSLFLPLKDAELVSPADPAPQGSLGSPGSAIQQKGPYLSFLGDASCESTKRGQPLEVEAERPVSCVASYVSPDSPSEQVSKPGLPATDSKASFEAHVREKFNRMVEAVDKTIEKRIDKLTKELAQKTAELLEVRAAFVQLSQKKQEVQRRERALSRQVDVAVEMIAALKQRLTESEEELHRKEEIAAKNKFNGHSSSFKLGATSEATLNYHCKIVINWEDESGGSSISLHVSRLIFTWGSCYFQPLPGRSSRKRSAGKGQAPALHRESVAACGSGRKAARILPKSADGVQPHRCQRARAYRHFIK
ncbi:protein ZNF365 isoform X2 [Lathamus discolor]|uniref:protein ZNF365 isoform X2 n=1 Tax=Lathamus discolor TaxID=678569 RepID=UPI0032B81A73